VAAGMAEINVSLVTTVRVEAANKISADHGKAEWVFVVLAALQKALHYVIHKHGR